ncbi:hypothetical protein E2493_02885 [Sphingomonas parva]|uniref:Uncharacterized protein n=1 Tax=Sphingomonas parva TaxID=2555898 RepID=A0A4Y8ZWF7_9SPHN|nr:hypothetical protein [Sphingomonas parva]TFI59797.1 hypothetical protein E2493_02885 [Sphingomonas parva]
MRKWPVRILLLGLALPGCAAATAPQVGATVSTTSSRLLKITEAHIESRGNAILVRGRVERRSQQQRPVWGHLHLEAWGGGKLRGVKDSHWSVMGRYRLPGSTFRAKLDVPPEMVDEIRVTHAPGRD